MTNKNETSKTAPGQSVPLTDLLGWTIEQQKNGAIVVQNREVGGCVLKKDHDDVTVSVLYNYFNDKLKDRNNRLYGVLTTAGTDVDTDETRVIINVSKEQLMATAGGILYKNCGVTILDVIPASA